MPLRLGHWEAGVSGPPLAGGSQSCHQETQVGHFPLWWQGAMDDTVTSTRQLTPKEKLDKPKPRRRISYNLAGKC